ncbi:hypothetical protein [Bacillus andreraoultii]|uniref:hypothetical protein n=1 Tax=Bacillus andreraoultii TaxID=1499685 RepID=UPI000539CBF1|nr:hypothetical protein [Bacillus andreraoultii]
MKISRELHPYRTAFIDERIMVKNELLKSDKASKWKKRKFDASSIFKNINGHDQFENSVMECNVFPMIFANLKEVREETLFPCEIFDGNEAWIGKDGSGKYRYITGAPFDEAVAYTVFDLLLCFPQVQGKGYTQQRQFVRKELIDLLNVSFEDVNWERKERDKYIQNKRILAQFGNQSFQQKYPKIFKKVKTYLDVLEKMLDHGQKYIRTTMKDKNEVSYFTLYAKQIGVTSSRFTSAVKRFNEIGLLFSEKQKVTFFKKDYNANVEGITTCYLFPLYSDQLFDEIEKKLAVNA